jgi:hypothetical protein
MRLFCFQLLRYQIITMSLMLGFHSHLIGILQISSKTSLCLYSMTNAHTVVCCYALSCVSEKGVHYELIASYLHISLLTVILSRNTDIHMRHIFQVWNCNGSSVSAHSSLYLYLIPSTHKLSLETIVIVQIAGCIQNQRKGEYIKKFLDKSMELVWKELRFPLKTLLEYQEAYLKHIASCVQLQPMRLTPLLMKHTTVLRCIIGTYNAGN